MYVQMNIIFSHVFGAQREVSSACGRTFYLPCAARSCEEVTVLSRPSPASKSSSLIPDVFLNAFSGTILRLAEGSGSDFFKLPSRTWVRDCAWNGLSTVESAARGGTGRVAICCWSIAKIWLEICVCWFICTCNASCVR